MYDGAPAVPEAMIIMIDAYKGLGMIDLADETERVLANSYPEVEVRRQKAEKAWYKFW